MDEVGFDKIDPLQRSHRLVQSLRPILLRYADLHPLILVVEDYHWLDASSVEVLDELFGGVDAVRLALLVTTRPERRPGWRHLTQQADDDSLGPRIGDRAQAPDGGPGGPPPAGTDRRLR